MPPMSDYNVRPRRPSRASSFLDQALVFGIIGCNLVRGSIDVLLSAASEVNTLVFPLASNIFVGKGYWSIVAEPPKCLGPPAPVIVPKTSDGGAEDPSTLEVR